MIGTLYFIFSNNNKIYFDNKPFKIERTEIGFGLISELHGVDFTIVSVFQKENETILKLYGFQEKKKLWFSLKSKNLEKIDSAKVNFKYFTEQSVEGFVSKYEQTWY